MSESRFLHIGVNFPGLARYEAIDNSLSRHTPDWVRYTWNSWIVWTPLSPHDLYANLKSVLLQSEQVLIFPILDSEKDGHAEEWIWRWIEGKRQNPQKSLEDVFEEMRVQGRLLPPR